MPIIANGVTIPTNGNFLIPNGTAIDTVVANGVTVWKKETRTVIPVLTSTANFTEIYFGNIGDHPVTLTNAIDGRIYKSAIITYSQFSASEYWLWYGWGAGFGTQKSGSWNVLTAAVVLQPYSTDSEDITTVTTGSGSIELALPNEPDITIFAGCVASIGRELGLGSMHVSGITITAITR